MRLDPPEPGCADKCPVIRKRPPGDFLELLPIGFDQIRFGFQPFAKARTGSIQNDLGPAPTATVHQAPVQIPGRSGRKTSGKYHDVSGRGVGVQFFGQFPAILGRHAETLSPDMSFPASLRVEQGEIGAGLAFDGNQIGPEPSGRRRLEQRHRLLPRESQAKDRMSQGLDRPGDVDALAADELGAAAGHEVVPPPQPFDFQKQIDRRIGGHRDNFCHRFRISGITAPALTLTRGGDTARPRLAVR